MKKTILTIAFLAAVSILAFPARASLAGEGDRKPDRAGRQDRGGDERFLETLQRELGLDEEQAAKVKEAVKENQEAMRKAAESRTAKIRELLNEEQAAKFDEMNKRSAERRGEGRAPFGRTGRFGKQDQGREGDEGEPGGRGRDRGAQELLKNAIRNLELTDEQKEQVKALMPELQAKFDEVLAGLRGEGANPREMMGKLEALRNEMFEKIKPILTDEQKLKLEEMAGKGGRRIAEMARGGERPGGPPDPEAIVKKRLEAIKKDLDTIPEVWAILSEKIEEILKTEGDLRKQTRELAEKAREELKEASDDQIKQQMEAFRELRKKFEETLKAKREDLRELLDLKEEAKLIMHGVLD